MALQAESLLHKRLKRLSCWILCFLSINPRFDTEDYCSVIENLPLRQKQLFPPEKRDRINSEKSSLMDEKEPIATLGRSQEQEPLEMENAPGDKNGSENHCGERSTSSSEESLFSVENDAQDGSVTSEETNYRKEDVIYFDFEEKGVVSELDSLVDSIENFARSVDGFSCLSEIGFEDLEEQVIDTIEEKVIQEYGLGCIQNYVENIDDDDDDEKSSDSKSGDDNDGDEVECLKQDNTAATAAEILDDIIKTEREDKEVVYDPKKKESSGRSLVRKALEIIRNSNTNSLEKEKKLDADDDLMIRKPDEALKAADNPMESSVVRDESQQEEDRSVEVQCTDSTDSNSVLKQPKSRCLNDEAEHVSSKRIDDERMENIVLKDDTANDPTESIAQDNSKEENVLDRKFTSFVSPDRENSSGSLNSMQNNIVDHQEEEQMNKRRMNFEGSESGSQYEHQSLEIIHDPSGPLIRTASFNGTPSVTLIRTASFNGTPSVRSVSTIYDNMEVVYDPKLFGKSSRRLHNLPKRSNSCCDLREIATTLKPNNIQTKQKLEKPCSESVESRRSLPPKPSKDIEKPDIQNTSLSAEHGQPLSPLQFEGFEMRLNLDCYSIASSENNVKKNTKHRSKSLANRRRLLDPERLICGLKPQQRRLITKRKTKSKKAKDVRPKSPVKEKANNTSMDTTLTIPTEDEDGLPQYQIEVTNSPGMSSRDPLGSVLPQRSKKSDPRKTENSDYTTRISVTTNASTISSRDIVPQEALLSEAQSLPRPPSPKRETSSNYSGELVDLLHQISSYVDGIVENNNYSIAIPSIRSRSKSPSNKDGNEADDEQSISKSDVVDDSKNVASAITREVKAKVVDPINLANKKRSEKSQREKENEQKKSDLLSLFDNSPIRSIGSLSSHDEKTEKQSNSIARSLLEDDESDDSSLIAGSSVGRSVTSPKMVYQQSEAPQDIWEKAPVIYHMKSSPPKAKRAYRNAQKRTSLHRTVERHPLPASAKSKDQANSIGENAKQNVSIRARKEVPKQAKDSRHNSVSEKNSVSIPEKIEYSFGSSRRTPMALREESATTRASFHRSQNKNVVTLQEITKKPVYHNGRKPYNHSKINPQSNGFIVDENGFLISGTASVRKDIEKRTSFFEMLERGSAPLSLRSHEPVAKSVGMTGETKVFLREPPRVIPSTLADKKFVTSGNRPKHSTRSQVITSGANNNRNAINFESQFQSRSSEPFLKPLSQVLDRAVRSR